jgi:hypothetical protein
MIAKNWFCFKESAILAGLGKFSISSNYSTMVPPLEKEQH